MRVNNPRKNSKVSFSGKILSIQPRIRLMRSFDQSAHTYLGYNIFLDGSVEGKTETNFIIAIGKGAQEKFCFRKGDIIEGLAVTVSDDRLEIARYYKISALKLLEREDKEGEILETPPYTGVALTLTEYRERGCRRLFMKTYEKKCWKCTWGCKMPVEIIKDH